jgi:cytochrome c-type biogenesis protein CcmE
MKPVHIVILVVISIGLAIAVSFYGDTSRYVCFAEAEQIVKDKPNMKLHVVSTLSKDKPEVYNPQVDADYFEFYASDTAGMERKIVYRNAKPQDLDKTDKIVLIGYSRGDHFEAREILKKCPSKYEKK